ncbi:hypothetical protein Godav_003563, partial [Gossypium davidsonii]|nr:hypothetical protein [Gossypium davidsonii]
TEKCDVFSFGVLALELLSGAYPGEFLSNLSIVTAESIPLDNVLDQRLSPPLPEVVNKLVFILKLAVSCLDNNPKSRPTMHTVSQLFLKDLIVIEHCDGAHKIELQNARRRIVHMRLDVSCILLCQVSWGILVVIDWLIGAHNE